MKQKHREAMIAYGLKIAGLEEIVHRHTLVFGAQRTRLSELDEELDCLKHGANPAWQDMFQRVKVLEDWKKSNPLLDLKGVLEFSLDNHEKRLITIEGILNNTPFSSVLMKELVNRVTALEGDRHTFLPHQHIGVEDRIKALENKTRMLLPHNHEMHDQRIVTLEQFLKSCNARMRIQDENIDTLKTQTAFEGRSQQDQNAVIFTLQQQVKEINARLMALTNEILKLRPKKYPPISTEFGLAKKQPKTGMVWEHNREGTALCDTGIATATAYQTPQVNLLAVKKSGRTRKVKHD